MIDPLHEELNIEVFRKTNRRKFIPRSGFLEGIFFRIFFSLFSKFPPIQGSRATQCRVCS